MKIKNRKYNNQDYYLDFENKRLILSEKLYTELHSDNKWTKYKLIGGSLVSDILLKDQAFKSEFKAFCHITHLNLPVLAKKYVNAGQILEPKIIELIKSRDTPNHTTLHYDAKDYEYNFFKDKSDIFLGVPDGYIEFQEEKLASQKLRAKKQEILEAKIQGVPQEHLEKLLSQEQQLQVEFNAAHAKGVILELKTAGLKKYDLWGDDNVDLGYRKQAQLYAYLNNNYKYYICALFLEEQDYADPASVNLNQRRFKTYPFDLNPNEVRDDIATLTNWYKKYTNTKYSPIFDLAKDKDLIEYLACENREQWQQLLKRWQQEGKADLDVEA